MSGFLFSCAIGALSWLGTAAGFLLGDWRARRAGKPLDRGYHWAYPGDPDY